jgi:hypothetical protein
LRENVMGRVREMVKVSGQEYWALFDTGVRSTYIINTAARKLGTAGTLHPIRTVLGGRVKMTWSTALLQAEVQGRPISTHALVVDEIGKDEDGRRIEVLFGALAMRQWGIRPVPDGERLDLSHYPEEFAEPPLASLDTPAEARQTDRLEIDSSAFDRVSLYEVRVYAFLLQRQKYEVNFVLDIDYLVEWSLLPDNRFDFLVVPATLTFLDVVDLQIHLDGGPSLRREEPDGAISSLTRELEISDFRRFAYTDPIYTERPYLRYELNFWEPQGGRISLGATDFRIVGRQQGVRSDRQTFDPAQRVPLNTVRERWSDPDGD